MGALGCRIGVALVIVVVSLQAGKAGAVPAFPGAEGFGTTTIGGRGGRVIEVTNLNDSGTGSLRAAIEASGPRIVVFKVAGTIVLQSRITVENPYLTIAGQTAPGGGITIRNAASLSETPLIVPTHDVVIRHLRIRPGRGAPGERIDAINVTTSGATAPVENVVIDHCSFSWSTDETVNFWYEAHDATFQWNIVSEALGLLDSGGNLIAHGKGVLLGKIGSHSYSVHHNLMAFNEERNPRILTSGIVDVVNNVIYAQGGGAWNPSHVSDESGTPSVNYVGNFLGLIPGTGSADSYISGSGSLELYVDGNITPARPRDDMGEVVGVVRDSEHSRVVSSRRPAPLVTTTSALEAYDKVLADSGASKGLRCDGGAFSRRDAVDDRVVAHVRNRTGRLIREPSEVGGWPSLDPGTPCPDSDRDGMPDAWESANGLDSRDASDGSEDADGDGYTNVEEYLNGVDQVVATPPPPGPPLPPVLLDE